MKVKRGTRDFRPAETIIETEPEAATGSLANIAVANSDSTPTTTEDTVANDSVPDERLERLSPTGQG